MPRLSKARKELVTAMMKDTIFEAATEVLGEQGVSGTTMDRVAAAAKVAKSSLYDYFPSKEELLDFVFGRVIVPLLELVDEIVEVNLTAPQKLERLLRMSHDRITKHKVLLRFLVESREDLQLKTTTRARVLESLTKIFEQGIQEGSFLPHKPAHVARIYLGCLNEMFELEVSNASKEVVNEYVDVLIDATLHGLTLHTGRKSVPGEG
jgi:AcrR family transcriptional regulator